jgi:hypothetical protein
VESTTRVINIKSGETYDVYIGHQRGPKMWGGGYHLPRSDWRNPYNRAYRDGHMTVHEAIDRFHYDLVVKQPDLRARLAEEIAGKILACWCKPGPCHGDVLARLAEALGTDPAELVED